MIDSTAGTVAARFPDFLAKVATGEVVRIHENGHPVARLIRDSEFIPGSDAAKLFRNRAPDPELAAAITTELQKLDAEANDAVDHRH